MVSHSPTTPGLQALKDLFAKYPTYQRISFFAQDAWLMDHQPNKPEVLRVAIMERMGENRILTRKQSGQIVRPNGIVPCCIYGRQRRDYVVKWEDRLCFVYDAPYGMGATDLARRWSLYEGPYRKQADRLDWFKKTLLWTPKREEALRAGGSKKNDWEAYEEMRQDRGLRYLRHF